MKKTQKSYSKKKRNTKQYTFAEKIQYHKNRLLSPELSANKKAYSKNWLDGATDQHAEGNVVAINEELKERKKYVSELERDISDKRQTANQIKMRNKVEFVPYLNGAKAKLNKK